jgi:hypothetical protein
VERAAPVGLGAIEGHVGLLQQLVGVVAVGRRGRDADAGADHHLMALDIERRGHGLDHPLGQARGARHVGQPRLHHRELIAAKAGHGVALAHAASQALGGHAQQGVAQRMAQGVVDRLEAVQVDEMDGQLVARASPARQGLDQVFLEQHPIGQLGQGVVVGQLGDLHHAAPVGLVGRLQQGQHRADAQIASAVGDDEAAQQVRGAIGQAVAGEVGQGHVGVDHQRLVVHQGRDRAVGVEGAAIFGGHPQEEGVALDQADRAVLIVEHRNDQGVGLFAETLIERLAQIIAPRWRQGRNGVSQREHRYASTARGNDHFPTNEVLMARLKTVISRKLHGASQCLRVYLHLRRAFTLTLPSAPYP